LLDGLLNQIQGGKVFFFDWYKPPPFLSIVSSPFVTGMRQTVGPAKVKLPMCKNP